MRAPFCTAIVATLFASSAAFVQPSSSLPSRSALSRASVSGRQQGSSTSLRMAAAGPDPAELKALKSDLEKFIDETNCHPIMIRLAWHDSGTYEKDIPLDDWPKCGGANGSIRFPPENGHGANAGLTNAVEMLQPFHDKYPSVGWADVMQMASAAAVEVAGGPKIDMKYGRKSADGPEQCHKEGNLPAGGAPYPDSDTAEGHLRNVFYRQGHDDKGIVALSGAHTLGRAYKDRSGFGAEKTKFTSGDVKPRGDDKEGYGQEGGSSWTEKWLKFDNSYYATVPDDSSDPELLKLETDNVLFIDEGFRKYALQYKEDQAAFFKDYAAAHKQLSEQGAVFEPAEGVTI